MITKLPEKKGIIGVKEIVKAIDNGKVKIVIVANNCPGFLIDKIKGKGVNIDVFDGDEERLGTALGKPFPIAMVGYEN